MIRGDHSDTAVSRETVSTDEVVHVVAAVLRGDDGCVLLSLRGNHQEQGGLWEFPGGKSLPGETSRNALARELREELGISIAAARMLPLLTICHDYPTKTVRLEVFEVFSWQGSPRGCEGQQIEWVAPAALNLREFPAANIPIIHAVNIPRLCLVTPEPAPEGVAEFLAALEQSLRAGIRLVQFRVRSVTVEHHHSLAREALKRCHMLGARMMVNGSIELAAAIGADGVHLTSQQLCVFEQRPVPLDWLLSAACHNPAEIALAKRLNVDFGLLGPVLPTMSHPDSSPLGWATIQAWVADAGFPVFALGGQTMATLGDALANGCQGIAAISGLWGIRDKLPDPRLMALAV